MGHSRSYSEPKQDRSRRTMVQILDAAEKLVVNGMFSEIAVEEICATAGASRSSFYARVPDKSALLHAMLDRFTDETLARVSELERQFRSRNGTLPEFVSGLIEFYIDLYQRRRGLIRSLVEAERSDPLLAERWQALDAGILARLLDEAIRPRPDLAERGFGRTAEVVVPTVLAAIRTAVDRPAEFGNRAIHSRERLAAELAELAMRFVGIDDEPGDSR